jgi:hypothetical protein
VKHLYPDCRLAVFDEIPIRHLIRPSFRHASKECFEAGAHLPKLTKGQRLDAPDLLKSRRCHGPWPTATPKVSRSSSDAFSAIRLAVLSSFLATPVEKPVLRTPPL